LDANKLPQGRCNVEWESLRGLHHAHAKALMVEMGKQLPSQKGAIKVAVKVRAPRCHGSCLLCALFKPTLLPVQTVVRVSILESTLSQHS
jgi:hypothetical protein